MHVESAIGREVTAVIPHESATFVQAINEGQPFVAANPKSKAGLAISSLAYQLSAAEMEAASASHESPLLSRVRKSGQGCRPLIAIQQATAPASSILQSFFRYSLRIQHSPHLPRQGFQPERLGQEMGALGQYAMVHDGVVGVARDEQHPHLGATGPQWSASARPLMRGMTTSVSSRWIGPSWPLATWSASSPSLAARTR